MQNTTDRFWSFVSIADVNDCWLWQGAKKQPEGYGIFSVKDRNVYAHRFAREQHRGPLAPGVLVCHRCDNPACVNPLHLFPGSYKQNMQDAVAKGRHAHGERHGRAKLNTAKVLAMRNRSAAGESTASLAAEFGVCELVAWKAITGRSWKHVCPVPMEAAA